MHTVALIIPCMHQIPLQCLLGYGSWPCLAAAGRQRQSLCASALQIQVSALCACRVWDIRAGKCRHVLEGHVGRVSAVKVAADGATAITAADDNTARAWDIKTGACRYADKSLCANLHQKEHA